MRILFYRLYQVFMRLLAVLVKWEDPEVIEGENSVLKIPAMIKEAGYSNVLFVTGNVITSLGLTTPLLTELKNAGIECHVFTNTLQNPTVDNIEEALNFYNKHNCQAIIGFGGGSPMDCAKGVCARVARPDKSLPQMRGLMKVNKKTPMLIAVPTTAGSGSEITLAVVVSNPITHEKLVISDPHLVPKYAVLDPLLTVKMPPHLTACTGFDALTHAIEAYIGRSNTKATRDAARKAVKLIFENIYTAYTNGKDIVARRNMLRASFYAGLAFTRAYVGYVHALAHALGGCYNIEHGLANAVLLPVVLEFYGDSAHKALAELADLIGVSKPGEKAAEKATKFIGKIRELEASMEIPTKLNCIRDEDLTEMIHHALREANPFYPVPRILFARDLRQIYDSVR